MTKPHLYKIEAFGLAITLLVPMSSVLGFSYIDLGLGLYHESSIDSGVDTQSQSDADIDVGLSATTSLDAALTPTSTNTNLESSVILSENAELETYASTTLSEDEHLTEVEFAEDRVEITYEQPGRLLALFPVVFNVEASVYIDGDVEVEYPWYTFLVSDNQEELEAEIRTRVEPILVEVNQGVSGQFDAQTAIRVAEAMRTVLSQNLETDLEANLTQGTGI